MTLRTRDDKGWIASLDKFDRLCYKLKIFFFLKNTKADAININPEIMGGTPVFTGTRVPIETLFDHLESGITIDAFLDDYPTVSKEQVVQVLELVGRLFTTDKIQLLYEIAS